MREPFKHNQGEPYERPNQAWICGLECEACPTGPGSKGRCPSASACHPVRDGDRWRCNRSKLRGGPCEDGPSPTGECCHVYSCNPIRSLRTQRGRFVVGCCLAIFGALFVLLSANWRNNVLLPGALSTHHAPILERGNQSERCANCHAAGSQTFGEWLLHAKNDSLAEPSQTQLCMECHAKQIPQEWATAAHSVSHEELKLVSNTETVQDRHVDPLQPVACATCHREHHGAEHDLTWMSDNACQACHQEQYHSFADGHPEFENWPSQRRTQIAFDHAAHEAKHFPKEKQEFSCTVCHQQAVDGDFQRTLDYESTCAKCHDRDMRASWEKGLPLFSLPMLEMAAFEDEELDVGQWPEEASDEFDGALPPITKILLLADPKGKAALAKLGVGFDFFDVDIDDSESLEAAAEVVWATKRLLHEILEDGQSALGRRISAILGREILPHELADLTAHLTPESLEVISDEWLTNLPAEIAGKDSSEEPQSAATENASLDRSAAQKLVSSGGWFRDELTLSIRYQPLGHDDRWLAAWIDVLAEATHGENADAVEPLLRTIMKPTAAGQCGSCHSVDRALAGGLIVNWFSKQAAHPTAEFTRFSHRPHLVQAELADCRSCHQIDSTAEVMASYVKDSPLVFEQGFQSITKQQCSECHKKHVAGDSCLQCHNYHISGHDAE